MPLAEVTWHCACRQCACVVEVSTSSAICGNCGNGHHHNMVNDR
jgi:hypothetical protein